jgi:hypothetical protein
MAFCGGTVAQAQRRTMIYLPKYDEEPYHFGFILAYNEMIYTLDPKEKFQFIDQKDKWPSPEIDFNSDDVENIYLYDIRSQRVPGFTVGIIGNLRLAQYFDLRFIPSISFGERKMDYGVNLIKENDSISIYFTKSIHSTFVEFPLQVKYRSKRLNNVAAYLIGGINPKIDLASQKKSTEDDGNGNMSVVNLTTKRFDFAMEVGAGFDFYNQWFKFGIEVKMSYGMLNIIKDEAYIYTSCLDKLKNKMFQLSFTFE